MEPKFKSILINSVIMLLAYNIGSYFIASFGTEIVILIILIPSIIFYLGFIHSVKYNCNILYVILIPSLYLTSFVFMPEKTHISYLIIFIVINLLSCFLGVKIGRHISVEDIEEAKAENTRIKKEEKLEKKLNKQNK